MRIKLIQLIFNANSENKIINGFSYDAGKCIKVEKVEIKRREEVIKMNSMGVRKKDNSVHAFYRPQFV